MSAVDDFARGEVEEGPRTQPAVVEGLTAADYVAGLRALADLIEEHGIPSSRKHQKQPLKMTFFVESAAAVKDFAARHGLPVEVNGNHTTIGLAAGLNPNTFYEAGTAVLSVVHIDHSAEQEQAEESAAEEAPTTDEYVCPEDGCSFVAAAAGPLPADMDDDFRDEVEQHRERHRRDAPDTLPTEARTAIADALASIAQRMVPAPSDGTIPSLVRLDHEEAVQAALVAVGEAALGWYAADPDRPAGIEAEAALSDAITAYRAVRDQ